MTNRITELEINNFKSIKHIKMDCKRINVLIGKPNVGKSNILEALSLFIAPYGDPNKKMLEDYIRYEKLSNLFYDQDRKNQISVKTNLGFAALNSDNSTNSFDIIIGKDLDILTRMNQLNRDATIDEKSKLFTEILNDKLSIKSDAIKSFHGFTDKDSRLNANSKTETRYNVPIKNYHFKSVTEHKNSFSAFLNPPFGDNLYTILESNPDLYEECAKLFANYNLYLTLNQGDEKIEIVKRVEHRTYNTPYSLSADTLQRFIFHIAAIETNKNSILLLEEPESHSFPPYISKLADKIMESDQNQFFIATHSPYLLMPFIEQCEPKDIAVFIAGYENYETTIKALNEAEIQNILDTGADLFFNLRAFQ